MDASNKLANVQRGYIVLRSALPPQQMERTLRVAVAEVDPMLALKDVRLALVEAENAAAPMPSVGVVRDRMMTAIARGYGDLDWTALGQVAAEEAGLRSPLTSQARQEGAGS